MRFAWIGQERSIYRDVVLDHRGRAELRLLTQSPFDARASHVARLLQDRERLLRRADNIIGIDVRGRVAAQFGQRRTVARYDATAAGHRLEHRPSKTLRD